MDEFADFFDFSKPFVRKTIPAGICDGRIKSTSMNNDRINGSQQRNDVERGSSYAEKYLEEDDELAKLTSEQCCVSSSTNDLDEISTFGSDEFEIPDPVYSKYNFDFRISNNLPINSHRDEILKYLEDYPVIVLQGETGCGKTTQVPQFLLDDAYEKRKPCNIVVTQPRRIAAISNAERVATERNWPVRSVVGYQIGLDAKSNSSADTRILFCTTGVLLAKLIAAKNISSYTHIILDEVHERNKDMDFLMIIIKKLMFTVVPRPKVKIILMSATIDAQRFANYFKIPKYNGFVPAPIITVKRKSVFNVSEFYFNEIRSLLEEKEPIQMSLDEPNITDQMYLYPVQLINLFDRFDESESKIGLDPTVSGANCNKRPAVLIFLPGIHEIRLMQKILEENRKRLNKKTELSYVILHSLSNLQQRELAMRPSPDFVRKIILSTNIAESSITVPDVKYVIDFCLSKNLITDPNTNFASLRLDWASRNNCRQRAGRTGRVMHGRCYRMVTQYFYDNVMRESEVPEMLSSPLENIILKTKILDMGSPQSILALALDQPCLTDISNSVLVLKEMGALLQKSNGVIEQFDGDISFIGRIMANLPIDVRIARFIIIGYCFSLLEECIIIGSALNCSKNIFKYVDNKKDGIFAYTQMLQWANGSGSDLFAMLNVYTVWTKLHNERAFGTDHTKESRQKMKMFEQEWANRYYIEVAALYECQQQIEEVGQRLQQMGIQPSTGYNRVRWTENEKAIMLKVVIAGAFYPNLFGRSSQPQQHFEREMFSVVAGRDLRNTVYFSGFEQKYFRHLYVQSIKQLFVQSGVICAEDLPNVRVSFDEGSQKVFVTFLNAYRDHEQQYGLARMPGSVLPEVYKSIKMRYLRIPTHIRVIRSTSNALRVANEKGLIYEEGRYAVKSNVQHADKNCLPTRLDDTVRGCITHIESCDRFWFQPVEQCKKLIDFNNRAITAPMKDVSRIKIGSKVTVDLEEPRNQIKCYRGRVLSIYASGEELSFNVNFIDYGFTKKVKCSQLRTIRKVDSSFLDDPPRCFECHLAHLQPSSMSAIGTWGKEANDRFHEWTNGRDLVVEVYSVINGVANVYVRLDASHTVNSELMRLGLGQYSEENYMSRENNSERVYAQQTNENNLTTAEEHMSYLEAESALEVTPPARSDCTFEVKLNGPKSPVETKVYGIIEAAQAKPITIDGQSVNSVLLDNDPQESYEKYLAAACVVENYNKKTLSLRQTTLLPNIPGFGALIAMIFSPCIDLKRSKDGTRIASILSGLGYSEELMRPIFAEHDAVLNLDLIIDAEDIQNINQIRCCLDTLLLTESSENKTVDSSQEFKNQAYVRIKELIWQLLSRQREAVAFECERHDWNSHAPNEKILSPANDVYGDRSIFPLHAGIKLFSVDDQRAQFLRKHCEELRKFAQTNLVMNRAIRCQLCELLLNSVLELRIHIHAKLHVDRERQIIFKRNN